MMKTKIAILIFLTCITQLVSSLCMSVLFATSSLEQTCLALALHVPASHIRKKSLLACASRPTSGRMSYERYIKTKIQLWRKQLQGSSGQTLLHIQLNNREHALCYVLAGTFKVSE